MLEFLWKRRLALYVQEGLAGLDLLVALHNPLAGTFTSMRIQIKNYQTKLTKGAVDTIFHKLAPSRCAPYETAERIHNNPFSVGLLLSVGNVDTRCRLTNVFGVSVKDFLVTPKEGVVKRGRRSDPTGRVLQMATCFEHCNIDRDIKTKLMTIAAQDRSLVRMSIGVERFGNLFEAFQNATEQHQQTVEVSGDGKLNPNKKPKAS
eukprot:scaffold157813_cov67-Attheya_sp.AAC.2